MAFQHPEAEALAHVIVALTKRVGVSPTDLAADLHEVSTVLTRKGGHVGLGVHRALRDVSTMLRAQPDADEAANVRRERETA